MILSWTAPVDVAVAETTRGVTPGLLTVNDWLPAPAPSLQLKAMRPRLFVIVPSGVTTPALLAAAVTEAPTIGSPSVALSCTVTGSASRAPADAVCEPPVMSASALGRGSTVSQVVSAAEPVGSWTRRRATPRAKAVVPVPAAQPARVPIPESRNE